MPPTAHAPLCTRPAAPQVTATVPFHIISALIFTYTVYGMAGLRPGIVHIVQNGIICSQLYLIAVQVRQGLGAWGSNGPRPRDCVP
jgi:hypothetical protein